MADTAGLRAIVSGRVQGVFFRDFTRRHADGLGITGYVRNLPDGSVEVIAEGDRLQLATLLGWLKIGSPRSRVEKVEAAWSDPSGTHVGFKIRY